VHLVGFTVEIQLASRNHDSNNLLSALLLYRRVLMASWLPTCVAA